ncbi:MAG: hypothetical protein AB8H79_22665 [Myxococcota bacterium]
MRTLPLFLMLCLSSSAIAGNKGEADRLTHELNRLAEKGAWKGVERTYIKLLAESKNLPAAAHITGANAAQQLGDATNASRRYLKAERVEPGSVGNSLNQYRTAYGRLHVRRVEATCIRLSPVERPFDPTHGSAIDFADKQLSELGTFNGLVPAGAYTIGPHEVTIVPGTKPTTVQRVVGDSDCSDGGSGRWA